MYWMHQKFKKSAKFPGPQDTARVHAMQHVLDAPKIKKISKIP